MAYYDRFSDKHRPGKRDDWRDDARTRRPQRDFARPEGGAPAAPDADRPQRAQGPRGEFRPRSERPVRPAPRPERPVRPERPAQPADGAQERENLLVGRNPIREALRSGRDIEKLLVARGELTGSAREIVAMARERHIVVQEVDRVRLDALAPNHQGLAAFASAYRYSTVDAMLETAKERGEDPFLVILDGVTDPHNLGAVIRSAECAGAHGVIIPERRAVGLTPAAVKASAGAVEYVKVARVTNIARLIDELKGQGVWVYAAAMDGERYDACDFSGPAALVVGAEGEGVSRLVQEKCDRKVALPVRGHIDSLNASVAAGILMYEIVRSRLK